MCTKTKIEGYVIPMYSLDISMMVSLLGPLMILVMGGLVFAIVMAILMPIFDMNSMLDY